MEDTEGKNIYLLLGLYLQLNHTINQTMTTMLLKYNFFNGIAPYFFTCYFLVEST